MSMLVIVFTGLLSVSFMVVLLSFRQRSSEKAIHERLRTIRQTLNDDGSTQESGLPLKEEQSLSDHLGTYLENYRFAGHLASLIQHAGSQVSVGSVVLTSIGLAAASAFASHLFTGQLFLIVLFTFIGSALPYAALKFQKGRRLKKFNAALPEALALMARALRAGHSLASSIEIIAEQSPQPLGGEFESCFQQQKFGIPFRDALLNMGKRTPSKDLHFLVTAVLVQKETGGDLTDILDRTSRIIKDRISIEGEVRTYTAQGRLTGWILGLLPIIMLALINLVTPGYSRILFTDPLGQKLLYAGATLIVVGGLIIRKIVDIKV